MLSSAMKQTATYWAPTGNTDRYGKPELSAPVQISCRWEDRQAQIVNKSGQEYISKTRIFALISLSMDGFIAKGTKVETDPRSLDDAFEIQQVSSTPDLRNMKSLTTVYL